MLSIGRRDLIPTDLNPNDWIPNDNYCSENSVWLDLQILYFRVYVIDKSYKQVLTPVNNSELLLKLEILDRFRLVTFHQIQHKETATL